MDQESFLIINIYCSPETRKKRLKARDGISVAELNWRIAEEDQSEHAHILVHNYGEHEDIVVQGLLDLLYLCYELKLFQK